MYVEAFGALNVNVLNVILFIRSEVFENANISVGSTFSIRARTLKQKLGRPIAIVVRISHMEGTPEFPLLSH